MADATERTGKVERQTAWLSWLPPTRWLADYSAAWLPSDIIAGITLAALGIPEVMGYTKISGTPTVTGLYTILLPLIAFAVFGASRQLVVAADSATAAILAGTLTAVAAAQPVADPMHPRGVSLPVERLRESSSTAWVLSPTE